MRARTQLRQLLVCLTILGLGFPRATAAHRLDEYLQATRISIELDHIGVEINLTPGASVADNVFAAVDHDRNGKISPAEGSAYAEVVVSSLSLDVDGKILRLTPDGYSFPPLADMRRGEGVIRLRAFAKIPPVSVGPHRLTFANTHRSDIGEYLINALVPSDKRIQITSQSRDTLQHELKLEFKVSER